MSSNLYAMTARQEALCRLFAVTLDLSGNLTPLPNVIPDQVAPVIRVNQDGGRTMEKMRWGFPPPPNSGNQPVTNARNTASPYWQPWLEREWRCLIPATAFCEYSDSVPRVPHWFALGEDRETFAFAGVWRSWTGIRDGKKKVHRLFAFLTTELNDLVRPICAKGMPVVLTAALWDRWLNAEEDTALALQQPPLDVPRLMVVATSTRSDLAFQ